MDDDESVGFQRAVLTALAEELGVCPKFGRAVGGVQPLVLFEQPVDPDSGCSVSVMLMVGHYWNVAQGDLSNTLTMDVSAPDATWIYPLADMTQPGQPHDLGGVIAGALVQTTIWRFFDRVQIGNLTVPAPAA